MNSLTFNQVAFNPINRRDKQIWLTASQLAEALEYSDVRSVTNIYNRKKDEFTSGMTEVINLVTSEKSANLQTSTRIFSLRGCHLIAMFARTKVAKEFRQWVLDILDKEVGEPVQVKPKLTSDDTLPLRNAVSMATGVLRLDYSTIYKMVHQRFGIDEIKELSKEQVEQAVEYVHGLMIKVQNPMSESLSINAQNLAWHTQFIYSWYKAIEEPFRMLSPKLSGEIHGHIIHAAIFANHISKNLGYNGMNPERLSNIHWSVGFH
ncbi:MULTISPECIES: Bro-N domain-containing protein [unclassified Moraxella]|uniref:BRO-N domain-containing protein n=1 Tax=unclassified Moraxella TaxID=2685852 RepID=UPI00359D3955